MHLPISTQNSRQKKPILFFQAVWIITWIIIGLLVSFVPWFTPSATDETLVQTLACFIMATFNLEDLIK